MSILDVDINETQILFDVVKGDGEFEFNSLVFVPKYHWEKNNELIDCVTYQSVGFSEGENDFGYTIVDCNSVVCAIHPNGSDSTSLFDIQKLINILEEMGFQYEPGLIAAYDNDCNFYINNY
ncbi:hypothetical protein XbC2_546 [Xanthomonas phage XbC2]|nr:hypothetical protein XbC2_546 [Xanthomonas phage XbC2]